MKVLWLTFIPSPYRVSFFEELSKYCDLTVLFERESSSYRNGTWDKFEFVGFRGVILNGVTIFKNDKLCLNVKPYLLDDTYDLIVTNPPIRAGKKVVHEILEGSFEHLKEDGELFVVIQKKQGAESSLKHLKTLFENVEVVNKDGGYWIIKSRK
mgnify:CR=1 FL=1